MFDFPIAGPHPAVIISHSDRAEKKELVNALLCTSQRVARPLKPYEVMLDSADGLDWETAVRCDLFYTLERARFGERRGEVCRPRRRVIVEKIASSFAFNQV